MEQIMQKTVYLLLGMIIISLSACATPKQFSATGGSKADGIVKLSYEYGLFEDPQVDIAQGVAIAKKRCEAWGYAQAEAFGGSTKKCTSYSSSGCNYWLVTTAFQCIGKKKVG